MSMTLTAVTKECHIRTDLVVYVSNRMLRAWSMSQSLASFIFPVYSWQMTSVTSKTKARVSCERIIRGESFCVTYSMNWEF